MKPALEVPIDAPSSARTAAPFADRLEACEDLSTEGWTPREDLIRVARATLDEHGRPGARLVAMIRPRVTGAIEAPVLEAFLATPRLVEASLRELDRVAAAGAHDAAIGLLRPDSSVDIESMERLATHARGLGLGVAFLRTLDLVVDRERAMRDLVDLGMERVVTAGVLGWDAAVASVEARAQQLAKDAAVADAHAAARGVRSVTIVPGGGVRSSNAREFMRVSVDLHSSCRVGGELDAAEGRALRAVLDSGR
jgi:copper homeostasis protein